MWRSVISPTLAFEYETILKRDADDDRILDVAVRAQTPVVTFNRRDFAGTERFGVQVMSPKQLLIAMGDQQGT
jgi:hypothetical protein